MLHSLSLLQILCLAVMVGSLARAAWIDLKTFILPDTLTATALVAGLVVAAIDPLRADLTQALWGAAAGMGGSWALRWIFFRIRKQEGLGLGDVKLLGAAGIWSGVDGVISTAFYGSILTITIVAVRALLLKKGTLKDLIPFGPGLIAGLWLTLLFGSLSSLISNF